MNIEFRIDKTEISGLTVGPPGKQEPWIGLHLVLRNRQGALQDVPWVAMTMQEARGLLEALTMAIAGQQETPRSPQTPPQH